MDLAREVSFAETVEADGRVASCGLSLPEAIRYAYWNRCPLKRLDASTALLVSTNAATDKECCPLSPVFTVGNAKTQATESKHVINRELWAALQFPIGDDVSAFFRCEAARCSELATLKTISEYKRTPFRSDADAQSRWITQRWAGHWREKVCAAMCPRYRLYGNLPEAKPIPPVNE